MKNRPGLAQHLILKDCSEWNFIIYWSKTWSPLEYKIMYTKYMFFTADGSGLTGPLSRYWPHKVNGLVEWQNKYIN